MSLTADVKEELARLAATKTVGDVLGDPESWPNYVGTRTRGIPDMRGAVISEVMDVDDGLAVSTQGSACGNTFAVFAIADAGVRARLANVLKAGLDVHQAVLLAI